jgi:hypothetical protein
MLQLLHLPDSLLRNRLFYPQRSSAIALYVKPLSEKLEQLRKLEHFEQTPACYNVSVTFHIFAERGAQRFFHGSRTSRSTVCLTIDETEDYQGPSPGGRSWKTTSMFSF